MPFKFESPVKLPRWTSDEFRELKRKYVEKYGYTVYVPGYKDIFKWDVIPEPSKQELYWYKDKNINLLGEKRYEDIKLLMSKKKEKFLRMLGSPTPNIILNISSIMTTLDDVNDALGTFAAVARIAAHFLPKAASKLISGPAGWALMGAELANIPMQLSRLPLRPHHIQKELHDMVKNHPLSKKAKLCRLNKLKRLRLTKGQMIEALQTTENMFGVGLSLGPIIGALFEVPSGLVRHVLGEKVTIEGPHPVLYWFDKIWCNLIKSAATLFTGLPKELDQDLTKSMVAVNIAAQVARTHFPFHNPLDIIDQVGNLLTRARTPEHPSTRSIIEDELGNPDDYTGWAFSNDQEILTTKIINENVDMVIHNVTEWRERNSRDIESMVGAQNMVEAGLHIVGALNTDDCLLLEYDPHTETMLKLFNQGYRYPWSIEPEQVECFRKNLEDHHDFYGATDYRDAFLISKELCCFEFVTRTPDGTEKPVDLSDFEALEISLDPHLKYLDKITWLSGVLVAHSATFTLNARIYSLYRLSAYMTWFQENQWPAGHPTTPLCISIGQAFFKLFNQLKIPITKTICCRTHHLPVFTPDMLPPGTQVAPGFPIRAEEF